MELTAEMASDIFKKGVSDAKSKKTNDSDALADSDVDTVHYWIYAPGQNADKWEECYKNGYMLLGWGEIGDLGVFSSKDEMKQQMKKEYGDSSSYKNSAHATWQFVHDIKIGDVCEYADTCRTKLYNAFADDCGVGIAEYIRHERLKLAYSLLKSGEFTVAEVSEKSGFSDYNYFSRIFKRRYGISPYKIFKTE